MRLFLCAVLLFCPGSEASVWRDEPTQITNCVREIGRVFRLQTREQLKDVPGKLQTLVEGAPIEDARRPVEGLVLRVEDRIRVLLFGTNRVVREPYWPTTNIPLFGRGHGWIIEQPGFRPYFTGRRRTFEYPERDNNPDRYLTSWFRRQFGRFAEVFRLQYVYAMEERQLWEKDPERFYRRAEVQLGERLLRAWQDRLERRPKSAASQLAIRERT